MLVYFTILSFVTIGVYTLLDYVQKTNARIINTTQLTEQVDETVTFIRTRLQNADAVLVEDISANDSACLGYESRRMDTVRGTWLTGEKLIIRDSDFSEFSGNDNRSISVWVWAPTTQAGRNWIVHMGRQNSDGRQFSLYLDNGFPILDFKDANIRPTDTTIDLRDGVWHHIAVTMSAAQSTTSIADSDFSFFVDGTEVTTEFDGDNTVLAQPLNTLAGTGGQGLIVGGRKEDGTESYHGAIFDVRLWNTKLADVDVRSLFNARHRESTIAGSNEVARWRLDEVPSDNQTVPDDSSGAANAGQIQQIDGVLNAADLPFSTTEETRIARAFGMYDLDGDSRHELWFNENLVIVPGTGLCPNNAEGSPGWTRMSKDIFTTSGDGFFAPTKDNLRSVSFNLGFQSETNNAETRNREVRQSSVGINQRFRSDDLCRHGHPVSFLTPGSCTDNISAAYAWISEDYDNVSDSLVIIGVDGIEDGLETVYNDVPFADNVTARWDPRTGIMTFRRSDNGTAPNETWEQALRAIGYKPASNNYITTKTLKFSLGRLSFEIDGVDHFYNFHADTTPDNWTAARDAARSNENRFCGIQGYLATVTSARENAFLADRFINADGTWPKGYLGGFDNDTSNSVHHWQWAAPSPEAGQRFWFGDGSGSPIIENNTVAGAVASDSQWDSVRVDIDPDTSGDLNWHQVKSTAPVTIRFTNFSGGDENITDSTDSCGTGGSDDCEPNNNGNKERWLQITGGVGHGLWNDMIVNQTCSSSIYAVCGYYEEWSDDNASIRLVDKVTLDLRKYREFCLAD